jgi:hypothetical protein
VFLAECSRDRREARDSIASELACCGFRVLPDERLPDDEDEYLAAVGALLEPACCLSIWSAAATAGCPTATASNPSSYCRTNSPQPAAAATACAG